MLSTNIRIYQDFRIYQVNPAPDIAQDHNNTIPAVEEKEKHHKVEDEKMLILLFTEQADLLFAHQLYLLNARKCECQKM